VEWGVKMSALCARGMKKCEIPNPDK